MQKDGMTVGMTKKGESMSLITNISKEFQTHEQEIFRLNMKKKAEIMVL